MLGAYMLGARVLAAAAGASSLATASADRLLHQPAVAAAVATRPPAAAPVAPPPPPPPPPPPLSPPLPSPPQAQAPQAQAPPAPPPAPRRLLSFLRPPATRPSESPPAPRGDSLDAASAARVVRAWQEAKAAALGGRRDVVQLERVLAGPMLKQWKARAENVRHDGFFWEARPCSEHLFVHPPLPPLSLSLSDALIVHQYTLTDLAIERVAVSPDGRSAEVEATLAETAVLRDYREGSAMASGAELEAYESVYRCVEWSEETNVEVNHA